MVGTGWLYMVREETLAAHFYAWTSSWEFESEAPELARIIERTEIH